MKAWLGWLWEVVDVVFPVVAAISVGILLLVQSCGVGFDMGRNEICGAECGAHFVIEDSRCVCLVPQAGR